MFTVFIGSSNESKRYTEVISTAVNAHPLFRANPWWSSFKNGKSTFDQINKQLANNDFAIFVTAPDDIATVRSETVPIVRANVLLEYGMFSGHLGPENSLRIHIGKTRDPSDLYGVIDVFSLVDYVPYSSPTLDEIKILRSAATAALSQLLTHTDGNARLDIDFMRTDNLYAISGASAQITKLLEYRQQSLLLSKSTSFGSYDTVERTLSRFTKDNAETVGVEGHESTLLNYIDFNRISEHPNDEELLWRAFSHFIASTVVYVFPDNPPSRFAIHDADDQLSFLSLTLKSLQAKPAIVRLGDQSKASEVLGRYFRSERSALLQAVTSTGNIPSCCSLALEDNGLKNVALFSMIAKYEHISEIERNCDSVKMRFFPMLLQLADGSFITPNMANF